MSEYDYDPLVADRKTIVGRLRYLAETIAVPEAKTMLHSAARTTEELIRNVEVLVELLEDDIYTAKGLPQDRAVKSTLKALKNIKHTNNEKEAA